MDSELARIAASVEGRLHQRFPTTPFHLVRACVEEAVLGWTDARVRTFLAILIERQATASLRALPKAVQRREEEGLVVPHADDGRGPRSTVIDCAATVSASPAPT